MKVEFLVNQGIGDGRQILIDASEFLKGEKDDEEFNSFAFATQVFFSFYGIDSYIYPNEYDYIRQHLDKNGAVVITVTEEKYPRRVYPQVYVLNNHRLKLLDLSNAVQQG